MCILDMHSPPSYVSSRWKALWHAVTKKHNDRTARLGGPEDNAAARPLKLLYFDHLGLPSILPSCLNVVTCLRRRLPGLPLSFKANCCRFSKTGCVNSFQRRSSNIV